MAGYPTSLVLGEVFDKKERKSMVRTRCGSPHFFRSAKKTGTRMIATTAQRLSASIKWTEEVASCFFRGHLERERKQSMLNKRAEPGESSHSK